MSSHEMTLATVLWKRVPERMDPDLMPNYGNALNLPGNFHHSPLVLFFGGVTAGLHKALFRHLKMELGVTEMFPQERCLDIFHQGHLLHTLQGSRTALLDLI
jgi:hypothetical protein